jgi:competence protein ComEC
VAIGAVPVRLLASGWPPPNAVVVACDVGQGDALVLPDGPNDAVVVDTGPEPAAVETCLHRLGVRTVAALVFTHFHADHVGGVTGVFEGHQVGAVVLPAFHEPDIGYRAVLDAAAQHRVAITAAAVGWTLRRGGLELRAIGPMRTLTGTRSDPNNNSLVLRATSHGVSVLLEGDAETEEQGELLTDADRADLRADVLKVAHHGSAYQDPALFDVVHPAVALVSVGVDNPYGHPNPGLLAALVRGGVRVLRTDQDGDIAVVATDHGIAVVQSRSPPGR